MAGWMAVQMVARDRTGLVLSVNLIVLVRGTSEPAAAESLEL